MHSEINLFNIRSKSLRAILKTMTYSIELGLLLAILTTITSCSGNEDSSDPIVESSDPDNNTNDPDAPVENSRLPKAVYDQVSFTASYMVDTDQDGDDDIILGPANGPGSDMLLINDGNGFFEIKANAFPARYQGSNGQTVNITSADFNNDGSPDIIASTIDGREATFSQSAKIHLYLNNGNNTFSDGTSQIVDNLISIGWVEWIRTGDFNNDGNIDFLTTAAGGFGMDTYFNDGNSNFNRTVIRMNDNRELGEYTHEVLAWDEVVDTEARLGRFPLDVFVGDIDNDGDTDLVAPNGYAGGKWATFLNISTGTEASFEVILNDPVAEFDRFKNGALVDIDNDGFLDVIGSESIAGLGLDPVAVVTFLNNGSGQFSHATGLIGGTAPALVHARQWLVADFNSNGQDDIFIADHGEDIFNFPGFPNTFLSGSGGSLTNSSSNMAAINTFTHGAAVGDIDNDGTLDLFMNNHQGLEDIGGATADSFIYLNNGSGVFTSSE
jgi:hypothetical protein